MWSSWMRAVFSTIPSLLLASFSAKKRCHSASENVSLFRASSWTRRLASSWAALVIERRSYFWASSCVMSARSRSASLW